MSRPSAAPHLTFGANTLPAKPCALSGGRHRSYVCVRPSHGRLDTPALPWTVQRPVLFRLRCCDLQYRFRGEGALRWQRGDGAVGKGDEELTGATVAFNGEEAGHT